MTNTERINDMNKSLLCLALFASPLAVAHAQAPDTLAIQLAMNESLELDFPYFQELANVQIVRGGDTDEDEYLFLCTAQLVWKLSSTEFATIMQQEIDDKAPPQGSDDMLWRALHITLADKLARIGTFTAGGIVVDVRFRVRLERAGIDWIVTEAKIRESDQNPLNIIDDGTN